MTQPPSWYDGPAVPGGPPAAAPHQAGPAQPWDAPPAWGAAPAQPAWGAPPSQPWDAPPAWGAAPAQPAWGAAPAQPWDAPPAWGAAPAQPAWGAAPAQPWDAPPAWGAVPGQPAWGAAPYGHPAPGQAVVPAAPYPPPYPPPYPGWAPGPAGHGYAAGPYGGYLSEAERSSARLSHFGPLAFGIWVPLIILLTKGKESPTVRAHAAESLNFHLCWAAYMIAGLVLTGCTAGILFFVPLATIVVMYVLSIVGGVRAGRGELFRYPLTIRMVT